MSSMVPTDLKYTASHEWLRHNEDGSVTVGITDHAQRALGEEKAARTMVSSTKSMHGHTLGAAGALEAALTALAVRDGIVNITYCATSEMEADILTKAPPTPCITFILS